MRSTDGRGIATPLWLAMLALLGFSAAAAGIGVRATYGAHVTADEPQYLLSALSLAEDGNLDIADELAQQRWRVFHEAQLPEQTRPLTGGRRVSPHDPLLPLLLAAPMALGGWVGAKVLLALLAAALAALLGWTAVHRFDVPVRVAVPVVAVFAASAPLAAYGNQVYPEMPAALAVLVSAAALTGPLRARGVAMAVLAVVVLPWLAVKYAPVAAAVALLLLVRLWRDRRLISAGVVITAFAVAGAAFVAFHLAVYEGLTAYAAGDHFVGGEFTAVGASPDYLGRSRRLLGLLVDREFGLAAWQPAWLWLVPALALLTRRRPPHWDVLVVPLAVGWVTATFVALTMHGYWFPGRQVVVVLPLGVLTLTIAAARHRRFAWSLVAAGVLGVWSYAWLVAAGLARRLTMVVDFMTTPDPWYRVWSTLLPAYRFASAAMWARHAVWLCLLGAVAVVVWRRSRPGGSVVGGGTP